MRSAILDFVIATGWESHKTLLDKRIGFSFIYGSVAKQIDTSISDIDLMLIGHDLSYTDIFKSIVKLETTLGQKINPSFYSLLEWQHKYSEGNNFIRSLVEQPKIFIKGTQNEFEKLGQPN